MSGKLQKNVGTHQSVQSLFEKLSYGKNYNSNFNSSGQKIRKSRLYKMFWYCQVSAGFLTCLQMLCPAL